MEPQIIAAIISASTSFGTTLFARFFPHRDEKPPDRAIEAVSRVYDRLRTELTTNCVRVLQALENGDNPTRSELREKVFPHLQLTPDGMHAFDGEFQYRLKILCALGLVFDIGGGREYAITELGFAFLAEARKRKHYREA